MTVRLIGDNTVLSRDFHYSAKFIRDMTLEPMS